MAPGRHPSDEIQPAVELRRQRHDADVWRRTLDFMQDVVGGEIFRVVPNTRSFHAYVATGFSRPYVVSGLSRASEARERLRTAIGWIDEIAFQMGRQDAGVAAGRSFAQIPHLLEGPAQGLRTARNRGRTKRRDAVPGKRRGDRADSVGSIEHVDPVDPVHVDVDEPGHDVVVVKGKQRMRMAGACRPGSDLDDAAPIDDDGPRRDNSVGQNQIGARQDDHRNATAASRAALIAAASDPSAAGTMANAFMIGSI
jgi:hypothetical protein